MVISQSQIDGLLEILNSLLEQITPRRLALAELTKELAQVQQEYDKIVGQHNAERDRLLALKDSLKERLAGQRLPTGEKFTTFVPQPTAPPQVIDVELSEVSEGSVPFASPPPPPPPESPRTMRKRALADHIYYFVEPSQRAIIMQTLNSIFVDEQGDVGDMLERLAWGPIWAARADWEPLEEQYARLEGWRQALEKRLTYWQGQERQLQNDLRMSLWQERQARSHSEWLAFLEGLAEKQRADNQRLANEVALLEQAWQWRQAEGEGNYV